MKREILENLFEANKNILTNWKDVENYIERNR